MGLIKFPVSSNEIIVPEISGTEKPGLRFSWGTSNRFTHTLSAQLLLLSLDVKRKLRLPPLSRISALCGVRPHSVNSETVSPNIQSPSSPGIIGKGKVSGDYVPIGELSHPSKNAFANVGAIIV